MSEELQDEVTSINSIYDNNTLRALFTSDEYDENENIPLLYSLTFPSQPSISLRIEFPSTYPDAPPSVLGTQTVGDDAAKGDGAYLVQLVRDVLADVYTPGAPCIFDLVEEVGANLQQLGLDRGSESTAAQDASQTHGVTSQTNSAHNFGPSDAHVPQPSDSEHLSSQGDDPPWALSDVVTEKKSIFVARAAPVTSVAQAKAYLAHLLTTDKKVARATHNITAWRIRGGTEAGTNDIVYQDCDDDGESAAGGRVLRLLELMDVWNVAVVVTRWYGGVQLGPDRFRIINQTAREAVVRGGFLEPEKDTSAGKKKGRK